MDAETARDVLLRHARSPRNGSFPAVATHEARVLNPLCGDQIEWRLRIESDHLTELGFASKSCAICSAASALLAEQARGWSRVRVTELKREFESAITAPPEAPWPEALADFRCFEHLRVNPRRRACAALPWIGLVKALRMDTATTPAK